MKAEMQHDGDPRYGWASIDLEGARDGTIVIHAEGGSYAFEFSAEDKQMRPTCACGAWNESECCCNHLDPGYWD